MVLLEKHLKTKTIKLHGDKQTETINNQEKNKSKL